MNVMIEIALYVCEKNSCEDWAGWEMCDKHSQMQSNVEKCTIGIIKCSVIIKHPNLFTESNT